MEVNNGVKSDNMKEKFDNKEIQTEEEKQSQHYSISVLMNHH